ncbi:Na+/H+ antiporter subunit E [Capnocytophaga catalasegens]|uniref:Cation:proton antiporter n=1 Tax=Capnocytophaga catalasegens TaxID=1004260 RepID=A0AAV5AWH7_9FLAO|nr:Na+/H+ antiporter subunit E [Capnocytophaga catalasegens]GIZ15401.1 cation:proton antiporter [Capnocytophaga catalasegens]GJM50989.1 cation:proton antiporter [Capnocytophaga catalasegens]GJM52174.1 cation:proton antiporter [Capnocytophaga catalasegens]
MIKQFLLNVLLMIVWVLLTGSFTLADFIFGFVLGYGILWLVYRLSKGEGRRYFIVVPKSIMLFLFFIKELIKANLHVAYEVMTPKLRITPGIVAVPLSVTSDFEILLLTNLISLTPGTFCIDVSKDRKTLYVHEMYVGNKEQYIKNIKNGFEKRILEITQ